MRRKPFSVAACVIFGISQLMADGGHAPPSPSSAGGDLQEWLGKKFQEYREKHQLPEGTGVLVYATTPEGAVFASAGLPEGVDENVFYRIASVSKTFTAAAVMLLDQEGKLNIDDAISDNTSVRL